MASQGSKSDRPRTRIGTRGSPLALAQAAEVKQRLVDAHPDRRAADIEIVVIRTTGDRIRDRPLADLGGKGLFTKEIEDALLEERIDMAVHSMKDMPTALPEGLVIAAMLPRADPRDALIARNADSLQGLAPGAVVGTASLRRQAQILYRRPDLKVVPLRGNVDTRLQKLATGQVDATLLACAGLKRLDKMAEISAVLPPEQCLPAVAQGAIGVEVRDQDDATRALLAPLNHGETDICVAAERAFLAALDGSCRTPIAAYATLDGEGLRFRGEVLTPDGQRRWCVALDGGAAEAVALGDAAGQKIRTDAKDHLPMTTA